MKLEEEIGWKDCRDAGDKKRHVIRVALKNDNNKARHTKHGLCCPPRPGMGLSRLQPGIFLDRESCDDCARLCVCIKFRCWEKCWKKERYYEREIVEEEKKNMTNLGTNVFVPSTDTKRKKSATICEIHLSLTNQSRRLKWIRQPYSERSVEMLLCNGKSSFEIWYCYVSVQNEL